MNIRNAKLSHITLTPILTDETLLSQFNVTWPTKSADEEGLTSYVVSASSSTTGQISMYYTTSTFATLNWSYSTINISISQRICRQHKTSVFAIGNEEYYYHKIIICNYLLN